MHWSTWSKPFFGITGALALLQIAQANTAQGTETENDPAKDNSGENDMYKPVRHDILRRVDPCVATSKLIGGRIPYEVAKACLDTDFPFPRSNREETAKTIKTLISSFFVFDDLAARPPSGDNVKGFTFTPVNIVGEIDQLLEKSQRSLAVNDEVEALSIDDEEDDEDEDEAEDDEGDSDIENGNKALDSSTTQETESGSKQDKTSAAPTTPAMEMAASSPMTHREFHDGLSQILGKARDGHLSYDADCFRTFQFGLGFYMNHVVRDGKTVVKVHDVEPYFAETQNLYKDILNCDVVKIGGKDAADYIQEWADKHVTSTKDANARFNEALVKPIYYSVASSSYLYGSFAQQDKLPEEPSLAFEFQCPGYFLFWPVAPIKANLKWTATYQGRQQFTDTPSYYEANCIKPNFDNKEAGSEDLKDNTDEIPGQDASKKADEKLSEQSHFIPQQLPVVKFYDELGSGTEDVDWRPDAALVRELYRGPQGISALLLSDDKTGIITIPSVSPRNDQPQWEFIREWLDTLIQAINTLRPRAENLILDLTHNGGGLICVGSTMIKLFFPDRPRPVTNIKFSPLGNQMMRVGGFNVEYFMHSYGNSTESVLNDNFFSNPVTHPSRPNKIFTDYLTDQCEFGNSYELEVDPEMESKRKRASSSSPTTNGVYHPWDPENMAILTDGHCGSTCALISNMMHTKFGVKTAVIGGKSPASAEQMSYSTFPGLQVIDDRFIFDEVKRVQSLKREMRDTEGSKKGAPQKDEGKTQKSFAVGNNKEETEDKDGDNITEKDLNDEQTEEEEPRADEDGQPGYSEFDVPYPANFAHKSRLRLTWRQIYRTGDTRDQFVHSERDGTYKPAWDNLEQWNEYSFIPATKRLDYTDNNVHSIIRIWAETRDAIWGPSE
ncbi:hypothetical protein BGZ70_001858 [Mortierella alpina]|uniref:Tail specific protease domain-containing protein n=1 Tax=Mortierella alpina TaxID=64518 RepID=A0A9P6JBT9_MORAP|nr:hypothetical protein BGZ70_001858 [Mortierella alpina]